MADDQNSGSGGTIAGRLAAAGVSDSAEPWEVWLQLRAAEGNRCTVVDLYELAPLPMAWMRTSFRQPRGSASAGRR